MAGSIHIKLEYPEAVFLKRDVLLFEESLLKIINRIRAYDKLKKKEFVLKNNIKRDFLELKGMVHSIESDLPREEVSELGEKYHTKVIKEEAKKKVRTIKQQKQAEEQKMGDIERELQSIREKLSRLS